MPTTQTTPRRKSNGRRDLAAMARDALAADLHIQGFEVAEVAEKMGYQRPSDAHKAIQRGIADLAKWRLSKDEMFTLLLASLHRQRRILWEIIETPHYAVAPGGKVAMLYDEETGTGTPVLDDGPKLRAATALRDLEATIATFADLKPPTRKRVETVTKDALDAEIEELEAKVGRQPGTRRRPA